MTGNSEKRANGERIADSFLEMLEYNDRDEIEAFVDRISRASIGKKRRMGRVIVNIAKKVGDTRIVTVQNDDVVNFYRHIALVCGSLPVRD